MTEPLALEARMRLRLRALQIDLGNFHLLRYRAVDGFLVTGKHSGSHWLKWMLSHALAHQYHVAPPRYSSGPVADELIGPAKLPWHHPGVPRIGHTHNLPSALLKRAAIPLPPVVVLVRDIRDALLSHHLKRVHRHGLTLSQYVRSPPPGRRAPSDVWWYIDFFNRWGDFAAARPRDTLVVRYEDLQADTANHLVRIAQHFRIPLEPAAIEAGLKVGGRDVVRAHLAPDEQEAVVPDEARRAAVTLSPEDEAYLRELLGRQLRHDFGYGYNSPPGPQRAHRRIATATAAGH